MNKDLKLISDLVNNSNSLSDEEKDTLTLALKSVDKELTITSFKLERTEKVKRTTGILLEETIEELEQKRKAVEEQNRELEIEASLERVRTIALSMKEPADMLNVCKIISEQLEVLNVKEIRNVQTAIINVEKKTYLNYEYYQLYDKSLITEVDYTTHPLQTEFANRMLNDTNTYFSKSFPKNEINNWLEHQEETGQFVDPHLQDAESLNYYMHSLGSVILGISTYCQLDENDLKLFKRFLNVFDLAYQRYVDIKKAQAQAFEASIEAALERVRARAMGMNSSEDLTKTADTFFSEIIKLNINPHRCGFGIVDSETRITDVHATSATQDNSLKIVTGKLKLSGHPVLDKIFEGFEKQEEYHPVLRGKEISEYYAVMNPQVKFHEFSDDEIQYGYYFFFKEGGVFTWTDKKFLERELEIFRRFTSVLSLTYRRYKDLKKAEAQAREAEIELSIERVRARAMAMHNSSELAEVAKLLFEQLKHLGVESFSSGFNIWDDTHENLISWMSNNTGEIQPPFELPIQKYEQHIRVYNAWKKQELFMEDDISGKALVKHYKFLRSFPLLNESFNLAEAAGIKIPVRQVHNISFFSYGHLLIITLKPCPQFHPIFKRFARLFEQTYTRFLDLQKAEAQAREAEIEATLERIRTVAMGMQKAEELQNVVEILYKELKKLGFKNIRNTIINIFNDTKEYFINYDYSDYGVGGISKVDYNSHPINTEFVNKMREATTEFMISEFTGNDLDEWRKWRNDQGQMPDAKLDQAESLYYYEYSIGLGSIGISTFNPISGDQLKILNKIRNVFSLAYQRYSDIAVAEAQAREAQIEAALERVRSRTMAMHKSSELAQTAAHLFAQLNELGIKPYRCNIAIVDQKLKNCQIWSTTNSGNVIPTVSDLPLNDYPVLKEMYNGWHTQQSNHIIKLVGEERVLWSQYISKYLPFDEYKPQNINEDLLRNETAYFNNLYFRQGFFTIHSKEELSEEQLKIIQRFAFVFEQTYTRFLDLENAEKQNKLIQAENERKSQELEEARELQLAMLPKVLPQLPKLDIAVYMKTATEVGGDYYDFHVGDDGTLTAVIGDATGHGMKAGTIVTITKSMFNSLASKNNILKIFSNISQVIKDMKFRQLSMCLLMLKIVNDKMSIASAAMPPVLIYRKSNNLVEEIEMRGMPLGAINNFPYKLKKAEINSGDTILLMSDGFPELHSPINKMYGYEKTKTEFYSVAEKQPEEIIEHLKKSASDWVDGNDPDDDVTFVVIKVK